MEIRKATTADCELIRKMAKEVFPQTYLGIITREQIDFMMDWMYSVENLHRQMEREGHVYLIAYDEGQPAGYVSVQPQGPDLFHLQKIYVLPSRQRSGAGKFLFEQAIAYIRQLHPKPCTMELNVNRHNPALGFYEHMGMKKVREGDFDIGNGFFMNDYIMSLDLS